MLDDAISGDFAETNFDESELSKLQSKLMRYLTTCSMSQKKLREEKNNIEELVTNISHQTKTPLTNILMYSELLEEAIKDGPEKEYVDEIKLQSKKLDELIKALVKMSRLETGILQLQKEKTSLQNVLQNAVEQASAKAKTRNIELFVPQTNGIGETSKKNGTSPLNNSAPICLLDIKWATEAVFNVLDNAIKYSPENSKITISLFCYEMFCGIRISDQGIGIAEEEIPKVFSRFYRGKAVHDKEGIGVGLYLARQIVEDHGGYIKVTSAVGKGSSFDICFPILTTL